ncbi:MAG: 50S ribosomal protein L23 [bacterium]
MSVIIKKPVISEKSIAQGAVNRYTFLVNRGVNKQQLAQAVEALFKVKVANVNSVKLPGKPKRFRRLVSHRSPRQHMVVTLKSGDRIAIFEENAKEPTEKAPEKKAADKSSAKRSAVK